MRSTVYRRCTPTPIRMSAQLGYIHTYIHAMHEPHSTSSADNGDGCDGACCQPTASRTPATSPLEVPKPVAD